MGWRTDALAAVDRAAERGLAAETNLADTYRERRADREFRERPTPATWASGARERSREWRNDAPDHVVVVVVDCLRADALGAPTPFLDSLAGGDALAPSTWTFPSVTSLLTGRYPHDHGAIRRTDDFANSVADMTGLPPRSEVPTLSEGFAAAGYDIYGGFGMLVPFLALSGRFAEHRLGEGAAADDVLGEHLSWLAERPEGRTFSYLHLADLHEPLAPPEHYLWAHDVDDSIPGIREWRHEDVVESTPAVERYREHRRRLYRACAEYVDNRLGAYHRRASDLAGDDLGLVVAGDHGEAFWERSRHAAANFADPRPAYSVGHGGPPYEAVTRVPLRTAGFDGEWRVDGAPASLVDVAPTLADAAGFKLPEAAGTSLFDSPAADRTLLVESARYGYEKKAAYAGEWKLVVSKGDDYAEGFALSAGESGSAVETAEIPPAVESSLRDALPAFPDGDRGESGDARTSRDVERRLANLGYR
ncbi:MULTISPECIES: sulfatase-like hydrolase/transferase [Halorussus]|uniref:sulfatase-like hydrolase/transferase n=1 Tax=Halorussus TaxID=1070314 RepID=UPI00209C9AD0|nr:sulfatase-like hydrolase/transferase [Halorussus vallis]USZ77309.1 sulfatase-like hydrolase/transferase [Halorussus vallis]